MWNKRARTSRPTAMAVRAPKIDGGDGAGDLHDGHAEHPVPMRRMYAVSPWTTPLSMMSALRLGRYSEAIVPTSCRTTTTQIHRRVRPEVVAEQPDEHQRTPDPSTGAGWRAG